MGQALQGMKDTHVFSTQEVMVPFKCDVHQLDERVRRRASTIRSSRSPAPTARSS